MSPALAISAVLLLHAVLLLPLAWAAFRPAAFGVGYAVFISGVAICQTGLFASASVPPMEGISATSPAMSGSQCAEILSLLGDSGTIIDRRDPPRVVVRQAHWNQLPQEAQDAVIACVRREWPGDAPATQVETRP